jgi:LysM repeat protein
MVIHKKFAPIAITLWMSILVAACVPVTSTPTLTQTQIVFREITPYWSPTPSQTLIPPTQLVTLPITPQPSATPFLYKLKTGDTLLGIAIRFGIQLEDLIKANPGINPHFLTIGKDVVIPIQGALPTAEPTSTALPVSKGALSCYPAGDGGIWCFLVVRNDLSTGMEDVIGWIGLFSADGKNIASQQAFTPLDLLPAGKSMPALAYFQSLSTSDYKPRGELVSALAVPANDNRYLQAEAHIQNIDLSSDRQSARVQGDVILPAGNAAASQVWVLAVAYDNQDEVVGVRKWTSEGGCGGTSASSGQARITPLSGTPTPTVTPLPTFSSAIVCSAFNFRVYSLGPEISRVETLVEARP